MRTPKAAKIMVPLGLALTVGWQVAKPMTSLIWQGAAAFTEMRAMIPKVEKLEGSVARLELNQAKVLQALSDMKRPIYHTSRKVDSIDERVAIMAAPFTSVYESPISQN